MMNGLQQVPRLFCFVAGLALLAGAHGCSEKSAEQPAAAALGEQRKLGTVTFKFDFGAGESKTVTVDALPVGATVLDGLKSIEDPKIVVQGAGKNAFVSSIGGKGTGASEGWSYKVNDQWADRSAGVFELNGGDVVAWSYGGFRSDE